MLSVLQVQDKVAQALEQLMLARALATNKVYNLLIAKTACKERKEAKRIKGATDRREQPIS